MKLSEKIWHVLGGVDTVMKKTGKFSLLRNLHSGGGGTDAGK